MRRHQEEGVVVLVMRATILFVSLYLVQEVMNAMKRKVYN
jgi:hypothetical protein